MFSETAGPLLQLSKNQLRLTNNKKKSEIFILMFTPL